jgi:hypothetical protein
VIADPSKAFSVCGFDPRGRAWLPRRGFAGTFDAAWQVARHPRMPLDYSFAYWNAASPVLQLSPHLGGNETISLHGLTTGDTPCHIRLPALVGQYRLKRTGTKAAAACNMVLDTVAIYMNAPDPAAHYLTLVWRANFERPGDVEAVETSVAAIEEPT